MQIALLVNLLLVGVICIVWGYFGPYITERVVNQQYEKIEIESNVVASSPRSSTTSPRMNNILVLNPFSPSSTRVRRLSSLVAAADADDESDGSSQESSDHHVSVGGSPPF
jgi:hypothetical protein